MACARGTIKLMHSVQGHYELRIVQTHGEGAPTDASICLTLEEVGEVRAMLDEMFPTETRREFGEARLGLSLQHKAFRVGQRVKVTGCDANNGFAYIVGSYGTVLRTEEGSNSTLVDVDGHGAFGCPTRFLEIAKNETEPDSMLGDILADKVVTVTVKGCPDCQGNGTLRVSVGSGRARIDCNDGGCRKTTGPHETAESAIRAWEGTE